MATVAQVRVLVGDTETEESGNQYLSDTDYTTLLDLAGGSAFLTASLALDTIASQQTLILKVIKREDLDIQTDGAKVADSLRKHAKSLREIEKEENPNFDFASYVDHPFALKDWYLRSRYE